MKTFDYDLGYNDAINNEKPGTSLGECSHSQLKDYNRGFAAGEAYNQALPKKPIVPSGFYDPHLDFPGFEPTAATSRE